MSNQQAVLYDAPGPRARRMTLIVSLVGGVLVTVIAMLLGVDGGPSIWIGVVGGLIVLLGLIGYLVSAIGRERARFTALFPTPGAEPDIGSTE